jgi:hypothetical protein
MPEIASPGLGEWNANLSTQNGSNPGEIDDAPNQNCHTLPLAEGPDMGAGSDRLAHLGRNRARKRSR